MKFIFAPEEFSWESPMEILDSAGNLRYTVAADGYHLGKRIHIRDRSGQDAVYIRQMVPSLFPAFQIETYGKPLGLLRRLPAGEGTRYVLEGAGWNLVGDTARGCFQAVRQGDTIGDCRIGGGPSLRAVTAREEYHSLPMLALAVLMVCVLGPVEPKNET